MRLSSKLLKYGYILERLKSSFRKFSGRYGDLIQQFEVSLLRMLNDILTLDQLKWHPKQSDFPTISWPWYGTWPSPNYEWFPWGVCKGYDIPAGNAYSSGHLLLSHFWFANVLLLRPLTLNHTLHHLFMTLSLILLTEFDSFAWFDTTSSWPFPGFVF